MTAQQKRVLIVLGILDLAVIAALGAVVLKSAGPGHRPASVIIGEDPCTEALLASLAPTGDTVTLAWSPNDAYITIVDSTLVPTDTDAQRLWSVLDALPAPLPGECPVPRTVTLTVRAQRGPTHTARLVGEDLALWLVGTISDADLAARALYRSLPDQP